MTFNPASITVHFDESITNGTRAIEGVGGDERQKARHGRFAVEQTFVHVDVDHLRATLNLLPSTSIAVSVVARENQLGKARRAGYIGALTDVDESAFLADGQRFKPGYADVTAPRTARRGACALTGRCNGPNVIRLRPATAARDIQQTGLRKTA